MRFKIPLFSKFQRCYIMAIALTYKVLIAYAMAMMVSCRPQSTSPPVTDFVTSTPEISDPMKSVQPPNHRTILIEEFKSKVLRHLNRTTEPVNDISSPKLPEEVIAHLNQQHLLSDAKQKEEIIIRPRNSSSSCLSRTNCTRFEFITAQDIDTLLSVQLLFYKADVQKNLSVTIYSSMDAGADPVIHLKEYHSKSKTDSGVVAFELPMILALDAKNGEVSCTAEVEVSSVHEEGDFSPVLVLTKTIVKEERSRRKVRSNGSCNDCCLESFFVTVEELGWEAWVHQPLIFNIGDCVGHCTDTHTYYKSQYQTIRNTLSKINSTHFQRPACAFWTPKCKPTQLVAQNIMYDNNGTIIYDTIPSMVIESCQCS
ncbi:inhibin beta C chain-like [Parasteatoda tepidariorum]|uniref:inhibin beta C chain-like n=1 Tax=Parasteatoda tepidariorum TaxID=114398 RepID=UPI00077F9D13|nr:inhibin beta C chain-like [Parasteatoda tepidariorum]